jgi:hypothetical protein
MPIKKLQLDNLHPASPINDVVRDVNDNLDAIVQAIDNVNGGTGVVGPAGAKGDQGATGPAGIQGVQGEHGTEGATGATGPSGKDGKDGTNGTDGKDGLQGHVGATGVQGNVGATGAVGSVGATGVQGATGISGTTGQTGATGQAGQQGATGSAGTQGSVGATGVAGQTGATGAQGNVGATGLMGPVGSPGAMNTVTYTGAVSTVNAIGQTVAQMTFTSNGYPIVCIANGDANPNSQAWIQLQWYRDGVAIGNKFHLESSGNNINCHYNIITPDTPTAGAHVYSLRTVGVMSGSWTFGEGGGPQLTFIEMSGAVGPTGPAGTGIKGFASGYVDAGQFVTLDNLKFSVTTGGQRGLCCATVTGTATLSISANYALCGGANGSATAYPGASYNTTPSGSWFGWSFPNAGDGSTYLVNDYTNQRFYRVTLMIGAAYLKNFISIERLG